MNSSNLSSSEKLELQDILKRVKACFSLMELGRSINGCHNMASTLGMMRQLN